MSDVVSGRQDFRLTEGEFVLWLAAYINPIFAFVLGSAYLFFGDDIFAPQSPTEYGRSIILVGIIGVFTTILWLILLVVVGVALFNFAVPFLTDAIANLRDLF